MDSYKTQLMFGLREVSANNLRKQLISTIWKNWRILFLVPYIKYESINAN